MEIKGFGKVGVLMGGPSSERQISLKSGAAVLSALSDSGVHAVGIDITCDEKQENIRLLKNNNLDCAFIALHGRFGEDGAVQEILEEINLPYTGSGVCASRLAMDKIGSLEIFKQGGLFVPKSEFLEKSVYQGISQSPNAKEELRWCGLVAKLGLPLVVKPANHGSSIGLSLLERDDEIPAAIDLAFEFDRRVILQEYIRGRELTVGVLDAEVLPVVEIIPKNKFFDFSAKYQAGLTDYIVPADLEANIAKNIQAAALQAHKLLGCSGCSRTDIILDAAGRAYVLEINTIPGMTATSLLPKAAKITGIDFKQLCLKLLELAYEKKKV